MIPHLEMKHNLNRIMQMGLIVLWCFWGCDIWAVSQDDKREKEFKQIAELLQIAVGDTVSGEVAGGAVEYVFSAEAGEVIIVSIVAEGFEPDLEINDADGWEVDFAFGGDDFAGFEDF